MNTPSLPPFLTLLQRQLADWQQLLTELRQQNAPYAQLKYCQAQIDRLQGELTALQN